MTEHIQNPETGAPSATEGCPVNMEVLFPTSDPNKQET